MAGEKATSRIADVFRRAACEDRAAFIGFLTAGDPSLQESLGLARALERAGTEILELGVPFSDPIADGPVLQRSATRALGAGTRLADVFELARALRRDTRLALVLFSYLNPLLRRGIPDAGSEARAAGFDGVLVTDLPPEEAGTIQPAFRSAGLDTIFLVSPTSGSKRMAAAAKLSSGFLYVVSRVGTTGQRRSLPPDLARTVRRARHAAGSLPVAVGFGIAAPDQAREAAMLADGVVVGSALVAAGERAGSAREQEVERLARSLVEACTRVSPRQRAARP